MSIWFAAGAVIALVLIAVVVLGTRRPRHAEDELQQPPRRPAPTGAPGSFDPSTLRRWLLSAKAQRRTGTLQLIAGGRTCSLYFLFGHLFHAESGSFKGEDALQAALAWGQSSSEFDPSAHLPSQETFLRPPA